jgi:PIN domain nuclease of toxin-antitoxin system
VLLLDTHALVWLMEEKRTIGPRTRRQVDRALRRSQAAVSAITFWEVGLLAARKRIALDIPLDRWRREALGLGFSEVALTGDIAVAGAELGGFHADPADRLIVATAQMMAATLLTADERILEWQGSLARQDARV